MADPQQNTSISKSFKVKPKLQSKPRNPSKTPESKYWSSFKTTKIENLLSSIPSIEFSPNYPNPSSFAAANLTSLTFFSGQDFSKLSTISVSRDTVTSCSFRSDGALIAAADLTGEIKVFNTKTRAPLRRLRSHTRPVRFVKYPSLDKLHLVSGGDDAVVKYWDVSTESVVCNLQGHKDYVRSGDCSPIDGGSFLTGSYDHTVKLWDVKDGSNRKPVMEVNHGKPVEDVMFLPSGLMFATAGGNSVKIWDVTGGGRMVHSMESHNKTVTSICLGMIGKDYRILSVGLDGYMKVFDYAKMKVTHSTRYPAPLMSIAVSPDGKRRAIGTSNGMIFAGKKKVNKDEDGVVEGSEYGILKGLGSGGDEQEMRRRVLRPTNFRYFQRSQGEKANEGDYVVSRKKKVKLAEHDKLLKKFRHKEAFVSVLGSKDPENVVAVMEELVARRKLIKCVMNLEEEELGLLLSFLYRYATMPRHSQLLMGLTRKVLELRAQDIKGSDGLKLCIRNLKSSVDAEIRIQQSLQEMQGIISPLLRIAGRK
ncbi:Protein SLOW WALKER 1 [Linum grandiflorum]